MAATLFLFLTLFLLFKPAKLMIYLGYPQGAIDIIKYQFMQPGDRFMHLTFVSLFYSFYFFFGRYFNLKTIPELGCLTKIQKLDIRENYGFKITVEY